MEKLSKKAEKGIYGKIRGLVMTNCNQRPLRPAQIHTLCRCFRGSLLLYKQKANREDWPMKCHLDEQFLELPSNSDIHLWLSIVIEEEEAIHYMSTHELRIECLKLCGIEWMKVDDDDAAAAASQILENFLTFPFKSSMGS
ncbi:hypothetical protein T02_11418 [Trichinella nativa]|uniref:Uncharacterized protein n=1 Tax=Trichinella nativa TaxID=6335 RepID=A0A0V1KTH1_9BILA|nr:hypothetical protein T02_11418 [Trichinella nativa]